MLLRDRTVIVTGGASGLGGATVDMIAAAGGRAVIVDVNEAAGRAKAAQHGSSARFVQADVTSEADVKRTIHEATAAFGRIDGLVNAAGIPAAERVLGKEGVQPLAHFARVITVNLIGTFNVIRLAAEAMAENTPARTASAASSSTPRRWRRSTGRSARPPTRRRRAASSA